MRLPHKLALLSTLATLAGCHRAHYTPPEAPMPPNTILLSQMMRELSAQPGFTEALLKQLDAGEAASSTKKKQGRALMTPKLLDELRNRILGKDWAGLDRFPGWTMREINPTVRIVGHEAGKDETLEATAAVHPGTPAAQAELTHFLDLGNLALDQPFSVVLNDPGMPKSSFSTDGIVTPLGDGVVRGDGPNNYAPEHGNSQLLAEALNRLAANKLDGAKAFSATLGPYPVGSPKGELEMIPRSDQPSMTTPEDLIRLLQATGHTVVVNDTRYFANFGHLHYQAQDVMMPFWLNTGLTIPHAHGRKLLIPASHAELEFHIHGPLVNADVSYYFGVDGKSQWRTMDTLDQPWVLKRNAHTWTGDQAVEATRLAGLLTVAYMHLHAAHPKLPFGGYYALGVCQDGVSAIELALTGSVTLYPNTADAAFFTDPRDHEINDLLLRIPKDRDGQPPTPERIFGSLPADPGPRGDFTSITIPGLAPDLAATYAAWQTTSVERKLNWRFYTLAAGALLLAASVGVILSNRARRTH